MNMRLAALLAVFLLAGILLGYIAAYGLSGGKTNVVQTVTTVIPSPTTITITKTLTLERTVAKIATVTKTERLEARYLIDALGRNVTIASPPRRIVVLAPSIAKEVCMLGFCSSIIAADDFTVKNMLNKSAGVVDVGGFWQPSVEKIISLKPDMVFACAGVPAQERMVKALEEARLKVFFLKCDRSRDIRDVLWDLNALGLILGAEDKALKLSRSILSRLDAIEEAVANETKPTVVLAIYLSSKGAWVAGGGTFQDDAINRAGGANVFDKSYGWVMVGFEELLSKNPDYVIVTPMASTQAAIDSIVELFRSTPLKNLKAYREGHVCILYGEAANDLLQPAPSVVDAIQLLASILHNGKVKPPKELQKSYTCVGGKG